MNFIVNKNGNKNSKISLGVFNLIPHFYFFDKIFFKRLIATGTLSFIKNFHCIIEV